MTDTYECGGPWPERAGRIARDVTGEFDQRVYPRKGLGRNERIYRIDDDPLGSDWFVMDRTDVHPVDVDVQP